LACRFDPAPLALLLKPEDEGVATSQERRGLDLLPKRGVTPNACFIGRMAT